MLGLPAQASAQTVFSHSPQWPGAARRTTASPTRSIGQAGTLYADETK
jgi:hypothetical protein